jgi:hypothetical protein
VLADATLQKISPARKQFQSARLSWKKLHNRYLEALFPRKGRAIRVRKAA